MLLRQLRLVFLLAVGFGLTGPSAQAGFVFFTINPANLNERALDGEQIFVGPWGIRLRIPGREHWYCRYQRILRRGWQ